MNATDAEVGEPREKPDEGSRALRATISPRPPLKRKRSIDPEVQKGWNDYTSGKRLD